MIQCYYLIQNVKGGDPIKIPAFSHLTTDDFKNILSNFNENKLDNISLTEEDKLNLKEFLKKYIHHKTVESLLGDVGVINLNDLILKANEKISEQASSDDLWNAIKNFLNYKNKDKSKGLTVKKLINSLSINSSKIEAKLFTDLNLEVNNIAKKSINSEIYDLNNIISDNEQFGTYSTYHENLVKFLQITNKFFGWKNSENLIKIEGGRFKEGDWNLENSIIYSDTVDKEHLFMALFKRIGSLIPQEEFNKIFENWNSILSNEKYKEFQIPEGISVKEFFIGNIEKDVITRPMIENIMKLSSSNINKVKNLLNETFNNIFNSISMIVMSESSDLQKVEFKLLIEDIFSRIYSDILNNDSLKDIIENEKDINEKSKEFSKELLRNSVLKLKILSEKENSGKNSLGKIYESTITINGLENKNSIDTDNVYKYLMNNLIIGKDIIRMPGNGQKGKNMWPYWVVSAIYPKNDKVVILGARINQFGDYEVTRHEFNNDDEISYRKYNNYSETELKEKAELNKNAYIISLPNSLTYSIAKNLLSVGDLIGNRIVLGIYPGYIKLLDPVKNIEYNQSYYSELSEETLKKSYFAVSKKLYNIINNSDSEYKDGFFMPERKGLAAMSKDIDTIKNLSEGDYFKLKDWKGFKKIIHSDKNYVWTFLEINENENNYNILKAYPKEDIYAGIVSIFADSEDFRDINNLIMENNKKIGNESTLSTISNPIITKPGDFIIYEKDKNNILYGKIINKEKEIALLWDPNQGIWEKINYTNLPVKFMSKDSRLSQNTTFSLISNFWNVEVLEHNLVNLDEYVPVSYVIDKNNDSDKIESNMQEFIPGTLYTKIGKYVESKYIDSDNLEVNNQILSMLGKNIENFGLYVKKQGNIYERNTEAASLLRIRGIELLSQDYIKNNLLFDGVYFSRYGDNKIYRIDKIINNVVYAKEYFRNKYGDILLNEIAIPIDILLDTSLTSENKHVDGSISKYYIQKNNNKIPDIFNAISEKMKSTDSEKEIFKKDRLKLNKKLKTFFNKLNIKIEETNDNNVFLPGQKAKFITEENGTSKIILKEDLGTREDLVHETMHIYLSALRIVSPETYMKVLESDEKVVQMETASLLEKEEEFLRNIANNLNDLNDSFFNTKLDIKGLLNGLHEVRSLINPEILPENINASIIDILNQPIVEFLKLESKDNTHALYNTNLAQATPAFLKWLEKSNINLKCK